MWIVYAVEITDNTRVAVEKGYSWGTVIYTIINITTTIKYYH